jgi:hypothetical protein
MDIAKPIVVSLGKARRKQAKEFHKGQGRLVADVVEALEQVRTNLGASASGKKLVPVVVFYKKKEPKGFKFFN